MLAAVLLIRHCHNKTRPVSFTLSVDEIKSFKDFQIPQNTQGILAIKTNPLTMYSSVLVCCTLYGSTGCSVPYYIEAKNVGCHTL